MTAPAVVEHERVAVHAEVEVGRTGAVREIERLAASVPVRLLLFDVLEIAGSSVMQLPYRRRRDLLERLLRPRAGVPALEAELADGSGVLIVVWLGRRRIAGISPGRAIEVEGRIGSSEGHRIIYTPRDELIP